MSAPRAGFPCGYRCPDPAAAAAFYTRLLGWECTDTDPIRCRRQGFATAILWRDAAHPAAWLPVLPGVGDGNGGTAWAQDPWGFSHGVAPPPAQGPRQPAAPGLPCWLELLAADPAPAAAYYATAAALQTEVRVYGGRRHLVLYAADTPMASVTAPAAGGRPGWRVYFTTAACPAALAAAADGGGRVVDACRDLPGLGRYALVADPAGVVSGLKELAAPGS